MADPIEVIAPTSRSRIHSLVFLHSQAYASCFPSSFNFHFLHCISLHRFRNAEIHYLVALLFPSSRTLCPSFPCRWRYSCRDEKKVSRKSSKPISKQPSEFPVRFDALFDKLTSVNGFGSSLDSDKKMTDSCRSLIEEKFEEREWSSTDEDVLRKLMGKHPVGQPGRWEAIAQGFEGKHAVESVIMKAKEMGVKKASDQDSFGKFLKDRVNEFLMRPGMVELV